MNIYLDIFFLSLHNVPVISVEENNFGRHPETPSDFDEILHIKELREFSRSCQHFPSCQNTTVLKRIFWQTDILTDCESAEIP